MSIVTVEFTVKPEHVASFMPLIVDNARASREQEPGCRQFDVCDAAVTDMVAGKAVRTYVRSDPRWR